MGITLRREEWMQQASCIGMTDLFFPERQAPGRAMKIDQERAKLAKAVCSGCRVQTECLEYAIGNRELVGIWGGMTATERRPIRRHDTRPVGEPPHCHCGCGELVRGSKEGIWSHYVQGHNNRMFGGGTLRSASN